MSRKINRRLFLRRTGAGLAASLALPLLEKPFATSRAYAQAATRHTRFVAFYVPNGTIEERWFPNADESSETDFDLAGTALAPLEPHKASISLFRNLHSAGLSGSGNAHMRAIAGFLTGAAIPNDAISTHRVSLDQYAAAHYQQVAPTPVASLQLAGNNELDPPNNNRYNNQLKNTLSFDEQGRLLPNTSNLRAVFERLFGGDSQEPAVARRRALRKSVLDDVLDDRTRVLEQLGAGDRRRVEEYLDSVRALERRLDGANACDVSEAPDFPTYPDDRRLDAIGEHARLTAQLLALAFACDTTRVATYMAGGEAAGCRYNDIDVGEHFHNSISHNRAGKGNLHHRIDRFHSELVAHLMTLFEATPHGDGTLLDGTAILYGAGLGNGDQHNLRRVSLLVGGRFGAARQGRYLRNLADQNHNRLLYALLQQMGLPGDGFGDNRAGETVALA